MEGPFNVDTEHYLHKQLYTIDLDDEESNPEVLNWLNAQFSYYYKEGRSNLDNLNDNLAMYLGFCPGSQTSAGLQLMATENTAHFRRRRNYTRLRLNHIKDVIENLVARYTIKKPTFLPYPKYSDLYSDRRRINDVKKFLKAKSQETKFSLVHQELIRQTFIFGEGFLEVFWNPDIGPDMFDSDEKREKIPLKDENDNTMQDAEGNDIIISKKLKLGDVDLRLWDPRYVVVPPARSYKEAPWVLLLDFQPTEKVKLDYPDSASDIRPTSNLDLLDTSTMALKELKNHTLVYKLYHRATPEMPDGRYICGTPECITHNEVLPAKTLIEQDLFPIIQLTDYTPPSSSRGTAHSVMNTGKPLQSAINNIANRLVTNVAKFYSTLVMEQGAVDQDQLLSGIQTVLQVKRGRGEPKYISPAAIPQDIYNFLDNLTKRLMQLSNVSPISRFETIPNTESRVMLDFYKDQEISQSSTMDDKTTEALLETARTLLAFAADKYQGSEADKKKRSVLVIGNRNSFLQEPFDVTSLKEPYDIALEITNSFSETFQGKLQEMRDLIAIAPNALTQAKILDTLEIAGADEFVDTVTGAIDLAKDDINDLLESKPVKPPQKYIDLVPYYEEFLKVLQKPEVRKLLPDIDISVINPTLLDERQTIGYNLLSHVGTIEMLLIEGIANQRANNVLDPQTGLTPLQSQLSLRFPMFPSVYVPDPQLPVNPLDPMLAGEPADLLEAAAPPPIAPPPENNQIIPSSPVIPVPNEGNL